MLYTFTYDTYGNNTSVSVGTGERKITSTATYSDDGNRLLSATDATGKVTTYGYDPDTNVLEWVQYPEDTADTRTEYTYDEMFRLASAAADVSTGTALTASYGYTGDLLTSITTNSTTYSFQYGDFALRTGVKIGDRTLATYSYTDRDHLLSVLDYGNDDRVEYTYDDLGRVIGQEYENGDTVTYIYDNSGALARVFDSATGRTTTYYYDFTERLMKYVESGENYSHSVGYEYDEINNLTALVETINGVERQTSYTYDLDNRVTSVTSGNVSETYTYDSFGRLTGKVTKNGNETVFSDGFSFAVPTAGTTTDQVASHTIQTGRESSTYSYTYDDNGNILSISDGTNTTSYVYDTANQLLRENNQAANKTYVWTYDNASNILSRTEYAYTTDANPTSPVDTVAYTYGDSDWGDLLTAYDGNTITYDEIGNPLTDGTWNYTWEHGRQLASMSNGSTTWNYTYNSDGLRTGRANGTTTYEYVYNGSSLSQMTVGTNVLTFSYDANGSPMSVTYNGVAYYYVTNIQGDIIAILDTTGNTVVTYTYDAWGNILTAGGTLATTLGTHNPLRYRGYVYDHETSLYYLQSRYYNPEIGRFLNADGIIGSSGRISCNMFTYCKNNPANFLDPSGYYPIVSPELIKGILEVIDNLKQDIEDYDKDNEDEQKVLQSNYFSSYKGVFVIRIPSSNSFSYIIIGLGTGTIREDTVKHEFGHYVQLQEKGLIDFTAEIAIPSLLFAALYNITPMEYDYYSTPWEADADKKGGVIRDSIYSPWPDEIRERYQEYLDFWGRIKSVEIRVTRTG